ncbi:MAG: DUF835 domain-containing protein [Thermococcus sp.]|uniref:DUF835 domain-containing protein n=1 Tax=Thermococcus guaymasensis DSM 11113 TaxID=1432656 RepID=A0A0X1KN44_9EURY|nr:DUF835 domain-containing protein [Thermococcus guaymasensis]AJC72668.1 hypothetical protein X802_02575 [Thermococcus guaymasensis DSM 11113]MCD6523912.1 DUF835 domain-containing protein [Thermococcus sp.]
MPLGPQMIPLFSKKSRPFIGNDVRREEVIIPPSQIKRLVITKLSSNRPVLLVARDPPNIVTEKLNVNDKRLKVVWISTVDHPSAINPRDLYKLEFVIIKDVSTRRSVVILDGVEYLILEAGLAPTMKFLAKVNDITLVNNSKLHVVLGDSLGEKEVALLKRTLGIF